MSEAPDITLEVPVEAPAAADAPVVEAAAAPAAVDATELETPEPNAGEGEAAAAAGQGASTEPAPAGAKSEVEGAEGADTVSGTDTNGAPEAYADFAMPDGYQLDAGIGGDLTALAKELNLPQAKAQQLIDLGVKYAQGLQTQLTTGRAAEIAAWAEATRADPEIGGDKLRASSGLAQKTLVAFGTPALIGALNANGLGKHPEFIRLLSRIGEAISEDTIVDRDGGNGGGKTAERDHAKRMYPKMNQSTV